MSAGVAPLIMVAQCCVMRTLIQRLSAVALNLKENPAKEKRAGWERVLGGDVQETNAPWIAASRCECSEAMLCQRGGKTGYRRTAVRHKFAASIRRVDPIYCQLSVCNDETGYQPRKSTTFWPCAT